MALSQQLEKQASDAKQAKDTKDTVDDIYGMISAPNYMYTLMPQKVGKTAEFMHKIGAIKNKKLLPVADLDRGFIHPKYPAQVIVSYFQAGRICDYINKNWGYDKLLAMMHDYAGGATTPEVIEKELYKRFYMHRTSHWLGLDVHDAGRYDLYSDYSRRIHEVW